MKPRWESERDQGESSFTPILRSAYRSDPRILAVAFIDREGECVDYCGALEPFDAKIAGAHLLVVIADLTRRLLQRGFGLAYDVSIEASERSFMIRRVDEDYLLVAVVTPGAPDDSLRYLMARVVAAFRREAGIDWPPFERRQPQLQVEVRPAVNWPYAPCAFRRGPDVPWETVTAVLGRWVDRHAGLICFRLLSQTGAELTVAHDDDIDRWTTLDDYIGGDAISDLDIPRSGE